MRGHIYISSAFISLGPPTNDIVSSPNFDDEGDCIVGCADKWLDNDPHFWTNPPTWGICRPDLREKVDIGDYVFFVLGAQSNLPQMIYGYMRVKDDISHLQAYNHPSLKHKRMRRENPNGNIIVDSQGSYNILDKNRHRKNFEKIKEHYVIGDEVNSRFLTSVEIHRLAPGFMNILNDLFDAKAKTPKDAISQYGKAGLPEWQVNELLNWLHHGLRD